MQLSVTNCPLKPHNLGRQCFASHFTQNRQQRLRILRSALNFVLLRIFIFRRTKLLRDLHDSDIIDTNSVEPWDQKADITAHKVQMQGGNMVTIYYHDKLPMLFEAKHEARLMPSGLHLCLIE